MKKIIILTIFLVLLSSVVYAAGTSFDNAEQINAGEIKSGKLSDDQIDYYKVNVNSGQEIVVNIAYGGGGNVFYFYNDKREQKTSSGLSGADKGFSYYYFASSTENGVYYLAIARSYGQPEYNLNISYIDASDAGSGKDIGISFEDAYLIKEGAYNGTTFSGNHGTDKSDMYKIELKKDDRLTVVFTPQMFLTNGKYSSVDVDLFDSNRNKLLSKGTQNPGSIFNISYLSKVDQILYMSVGNYDGGLYHMDVKIEPNQKEKICTPKDQHCSDDYYSVEQCSDDGTEWGVVKKCDNGCAYSSDGTYGCVEKTASTSFEAPTSTKVGGSSVLGAYLKALLAKATLYFVISVGAVVFIIILIIILVVVLNSKKGKQSETKSTAPVEPDNTISAPITDINIPEPLTPEEEEKVNKILPIVKNLRQKNNSDDQIKKAFLDKGWDEKIVNEAMNRSK